MTTPQVCCHQAHPPPRSIATIPLGTTAQSIPTESLSGSAQLTTTDSSGNAQVTATDFSGDAQVTTMDSSVNTQPALMSPLPRELDTDSTPSTPIQSLRYLPKLFLPPSEDHKYLHRTSTSHQHHSMTLAEGSLGVTAHSNRHRSRGSRPEAIILGDGVLSPTREGSYGRVGSVNVVSSPRIPSFSGVIEDVNQLEDLESPDLSIDPAHEQEAVSGIFVPGTVQFLLMLTSFDQSRFRCLRTISHSSVSRRMPADRPWTRPMPSRHHRQPSPARMAMARRSSKSLSVIQPRPLQACRITCRSFNSRWFSSPWEFITTWNSISRPHDITWTASTARSTVL